MAQEVKGLGATTKGPESHGTLLNHLVPSLAAVIQEVKVGSVPYLWLATQDLLIPDRAKRYGKAFQVGSAPGLTLYGGPVAMQAHSLLLTDMLQRPENWEDLNPLPILTSLKLTPETIPALLHVWLVINGVLSDDLLDKKNELYDSYTLTQLLTIINIDNYLHLESSGDSEKVDNKIDIRVFWRANVARMSPEERKANQGRVDVDWVKATLGDQPQLTPDERVALIPHYERHLAENVRAGRLYRGVMDDYAQLLGEPYIEQLLQLLKMGQSVYR